MKLMLKSIKRDLLLLEHGLQVDNLAESTNETSNDGSCACSLAEESVK